ncbi:MAG: hypothetical protein WCP32_02905 [Bacteroidota bacterium]
MMDIEITSNWIDRYNDNDLSESEKQLFRTDLRRNSMLRKELLVDTRLNRFLEDKDTLELMKKIKKIARKPYINRRSLILLLVAASILCLITFGSLYFLLRSDSVKTLLVSEKKIKQEQEKKNGISNAVNRIREGRKIADITPTTRSKIAAIPVNADIYQPIVEYELLVGAITRTTMLRVVLPASEVRTKLNLPILFKWTGEENNAPVFIIIINNKGKAVFSSPAIEKNNSYMLEPSKLGIGLFYWKILVNDQIIMVGKIITY